MVALTKVKQSVTLFTKIQSEIQSYTVIQLETVSRQANLYLKKVI